jgi:hypothetical protein
MMKETNCLAAWKKLGWRGSGAIDGLSAGMANIPLSLS